MWGFGSRSLAKWPWRKWKRSWKRTTSITVSWRTGRWRTASREIRQEKKAVPHTDNGVGIGKQTFKI